MEEISNPHLIQCFEQTTPTKTKKCEFSTSQGGAQTRSMAFEASGGQRIHASI
ncbi:hypothetical protein QJS04_geneDACA000101 [Acorus gramineus]|uniref:Uncharacterized protein n=1 Tax=Acorus gramineus TaxID=55184 RepID=A0AAV9AT57_ACOGR|nr:hypothetical protein QJS04_geneDACA000101 [Acorus gramineus]